MKDFFFLLMIVLTACALVYVWAKMDDDCQTRGGVLVRGFSWSGYECVTEAP